MPNPLKNLELKARCPDLDAARTAAIQLGARPAGVLIQTDTYFAARSGRLKLRQIEGAAAELIAYERADDPGVRMSRYFRIPIEDAKSWNAALAGALGITGIVRKRRELLLWHNVRVHLDQVEKLGNFVEFEAVLGPDHPAEDERASLRRLDELTAALRIRYEDRVATSYGELIGQKTS
jgi:adenylate cyclase class IV